MSEFTSGHLLLASQKEVVGKHAVPGAIMKALDEKWIVYLTHEDHYLEDQNAPDYIYELSHDAPVLYFTNFSDHFWGYRIFDKGREIAYLRISYELPGELTHKMLQKRYPEKEILELYEDDLQEEMFREVFENGILDEAIEHLFDQCNVSAFQLFDTTNEQIEKLGSILNPTYVKDRKKIFDLVEEFKEIAGIGCMSWIRYDRVKEEGDFEDIFE